EYVRDNVGEVQCLERSKPKTHFVALTIGRILEDQLRPCGRLRGVGDVQVGKELKPSDAFDVACDRDGDIRSQTIGGQRAKERRNRGGDVNRRMARLDHCLADTSVHRPWPERSVGQISLEILIAKIRSLRPRVDRPGALEARRVCTLEDVCLLPTLCDLIARGIGAKAL